MIFKIKKLKKILNLVKFKKKYEILFIHSFFKMSYFFLFQKYNKRINLLIGFFLFLFLKIWINLYKNYYLKYLKKI